MLHIILMILKILGILIISVLGAILFFPICYSFEGSVYGKPQGKGKFTWLCRLVQIVFSYQEEKMKVKIFLFGILLKKKKSKNLKKSKKRKKKEKQEPKKQGKEQPEERLETGRPEKEKIEEKQIEKAKQPEKSNSIPKQKKHFKQKSKKKQKRKWKDFLHKKEQLITFFQSEDNHKAFSFIKGKIFKLFCHLRPRQIKIKLHYGFEDPAMTGMVTGIFFWFYPSGVKKFELMPDFERQVLEGEAFFSGKVQIFRIVGTVWSIYHQKECKQLFKSIRKK